MAEGLKSLLPYVRTVADVLIVSYLVYRVLLVIKGTRAAAMLLGLLAIVSLYFLASWVNLTTLSWILENVLSSFILVIVVIFQDEIRRGLTKVGLQPLLTGQSKPFYDKSIEDITLVCVHLSEKKFGALIVLQREVGLDEFLEDAVILDAELNRKLLYGIFLKESPLHDGAVVIDGGRIKAAGCVLPLSFNPDLDPNLGTRHRAALGLSERCDAVIIIVSEENGTISVARDGRLIRNLDASTLRDSLHRLLSTSSVTEHEIGE
ncbi:MAG: diadenylate cyclase CdaA [Oligoflexia bacterium]|nr:diadenylate cyclase CdaA [Oligoflexia bacterium]